MTTQSHTYKDDERLQVANAFSPDYVSQMVPFKSTGYKLPVLLCQDNYNIRESIATEDGGKRARLLKASI